MTTQTQQGSIQGLEWLALDGTDTFPWLTAIDHPGTGAFTLDALTLVGSGTVAFTGTGAFTFGALTIAGSGSVGGASPPGSSAAGLRRRMLR